MTAAAIALGYLALSRDYSSDDVVADPDPSSSTSPSETPEPSNDPSSSPTEPVPDPPTIKDQRKVDFADGDDLPDGAEVYDGGGNATGLHLEDGGLTHGKPDGDPAAGFLEVQLKSDVQKLGARVRFADRNSGLVALTAWQDSVATGLESGSLPNTGMRLVVGPGEWTLEISGGGGALATGSYDPEKTTATFELLRDGDELWVVDPTGAVLHVQDAQIAEFAGPWASWGLFEDEQDQTPATLESLWAG